MFWIAAVVAWVVCGWLFFHLAHEVGGAAYWIMGSAFTTLAGLAMTHIWFRYGKPDWVSRQRR
jgi:hypothetical protein